MTHHRDNWPLFGRNKQQCLACSTVARLLPSLFYRFSWLSTLGVMYTEHVYMATQTVSCEDELFISAVQRICFPIFRKKHVVSFGKGGYSTRAHCVGCMFILRADFFVPGPFSKQWSEKLPLSFSAASLTRSPVCLGAICYASTVHPANTRCHDTVPTNRLTLWVVQSSRPHPCFSNRETFKIQTAALPVYVTILIDPWATMLVDVSEATHWKDLWSQSITWSIWMWQPNEKLSQCNDTVKRVFQ